MTNPSDKKTSSSLPFAFGILFGVAATFLFGTDEGRKLVKKVIDSLPEKQPHNFSSTPRFTPEETQHHTTFEAPPPPEPNVHPSRPEPFRPV